MNTNWLLRKWYSSRPLFFWLIPFATVYRCIIFLRRWLYRHHWFKSTKFSVPVIVVGNITVGGTGKTPCVIALTKLLREAGFRPGIISRGYGGHALHYPQWVNPISDPALVGDEAVLLARATQCPVVVAPKRVLAAKELLTNTDCNVLLSDDGLQHYALARTLEIAVIDGQRRLGNGFCLPAGPLREPEKRLNEVDFIICNDGDVQAGEYAMHLLPQPIISWNSYKLTPSFVDKDLK